MTGLLNFIGERLMNVGVIALLFAAVAALCSLSWALFGLGWMLMNRYDPGAAVLRGLVAEWLR